MAKTKICFPFEYKIITINKEKCVQIVAFDNSVSSPIIPAYIDDLPVRSIGSLAFAASPIETIQLPDTLVRIENNAFSCCNNLINISFPDSIKYLGTSICNNCSKLKTVKWSKSTTVIKAHSFQNCDSLNEIKNIDNIKTIENYAFFNSGIISFKIPSSVTEIGYYAFAECHNLKSLIMTHIPVIAKDAFINSKNMKINCKNISNIKEWAQQVGLPIEKSKINTFLNMELENKEKGR